MRWDHLFILVGLVVLSGPVQSQMHGGQHHGSHMPVAGPYAGFDQRRIKALSDQQVADLRAGRGMGLALPAELNGYPGPLHVLELADALALTGDQRNRTKALFEAMKAETVPLGERIVSEEVALDRLFAEKQITPEMLTRATMRIAALQGELRAAHLRYHLIMRDLPTVDQVSRYEEQRGYGERR
jgi:hypothetical protein